jgi:hypothetical protein
MVVQQLDVRSGLPLSCLQKLASAEAEMDFERLKRETSMVDRYSQSQSCCFCGP